MAAKKSNTNIHDTVQDLAGKGKQAAAALTSQAAAAFAAPSPDISEIRQLHSLASRIYSLVDQLMTLSASGSQNAAVYAQLTTDLTNIIKAAYAYVTVCREERMQKTVTSFSL